MFFHGSNHIINSFSDEFSGKGIDAFGPGIYFAKDKDLAEKFGNIIYCAEIADFKNLNNKKSPNSNQLLNLIKLAEDWESIIQNWDENINIAIKKYINIIIKKSEYDAFSQIWLDFYRYNPISYIRNMVNMGFGGAIRNDDGTEVYIIFNPLLIKVIEVKKINESKIMCKNKTSCSCKCSKRTIKENVQLQVIGDDLISLSTEDGMGRFVVDIEKYSNDAFNIMIDEDPEKTFSFDSLQELMNFTAEYSDSRLKQLIFNPKAINEITKFIYSDALEPELNEKEEVKDPGNTIINIEVNDPENTIISLLQAIKEIGNTGHGFDIILDPTGDDKRSFYWDGDGGDKIISIEGVDNTENQVKQNSEELNEAIKINLKLSSNNKRDLIKKAKVALDSIYSIYDTIEKLGIDSKVFLKHLDNAFEGTNEMLTHLVVQNSIEPIFKK